MKKQEYIVGDVVEYDNEVMIINKQIDSNYFQLFCPKREMCCSVRKKHDYSNTTLNYNLEG